MATTNRPSAARATILGVPRSALSTRTRFPSRTAIAPGRTNDWVRVATKDAQILLSETARLVADVPRDSGRDVVWASGTSELLVHTDGVTIGLGSGLVTIGLAVACDQTGEVQVSVPLAVGTEKELRGLIMSTFRTPDGPSAVIGNWAESLTAFAWECLLELARELSAAAGSDPAGRPLVPAAISAGRGFLLVKPMARNVG